MPTPDPCAFCDHKYTAHVATEQLTQLRIYNAALVRGANAKTARHMRRLSRDVGRIADELEQLAGQVRIARTSTSTQITANMVEWLTDLASEVRDLTAFGMD